jgi:hypothetical protein
LFIERSLRHICHRIEAVNTIHPTRVQPAFRQETYEFVVQEDVNVRGQNKFAFSAPDAYILCNHLVQRQDGGVTVALMHVGWHLDNTYPAGPKILRPFQGFYEAGPINGWVPLHDNELGRKVMPSALRNKGVQECLHPAEQRLTVVIIARCDDH